MVGGKLKDIGREDILAFAAEEGIRAPESIIRKVAAAVSLFRKLAEKNGVRVDWIGRVEATLVENLKAWHELTDGEIPSEISVGGRNFSNFRVEQAYKGNYHLLVTVDGKEKKYIVRKGTAEHEAISKVGLANLTADMVKELVARFF